MSRVFAAAGPVLGALAAALLVAGCDAPEPRARTVTELMQDPVVLQGLVSRCAEDRRLAGDPECANARTATERLATLQDAERGAARQAEFERQRELRRQREERERRAAEEKPARFDPYSSPVAIDPPAGSATAPPASPPPVR